MVQAACIYRPLHLPFSAQAYLQFLKETIAGCGLSHKNTKNGVFNDVLKSAIQSQIGALKNTFKV